MGRGSEGEGVQGRASRGPSSFAMYLPLKKGTRPPFLYNVLPLTLSSSTLPAYISFVLLSIMSVLFWTGHILNR
eukprot:1161249-Pelagomonas_calceolata.AAC.4